MKKEKNCAGFWIRLLAFVCDIFVMFIPFLIMSNLIFFRSDFTPSFLLAAVDLFYLAATMWVYYCLQVSSPWQATLGMKIIGIKMVDKGHKTISLSKATTRYFVACLSGLVFGIGFMMIFMTKQKESLHDKITNTTIIYS